MADNHVAEDISAGEAGGFSPVESAAAEGAGDSVDQMDPAGLTNGDALDSSHNELNDKKTVEDGGREDMFVDCPDEIENSESQQNSDERDNLQEDQSNELDSGIKIQQLVNEMELLRDMNVNSVAEKERLAREYEEERSVLKRELAQLRYQLEVLNEQQSTQAENADESGASLHEMISECSRLVKNILHEHIQTEEKVRELHSVVAMKDQEIDFLNAKVAELSESNNIAQSDLSARHENLSQLYEVQLEKDRHIEEFVNRILASVSMIHHQEELVDGSLTEKISNIEKSVTQLVEKYNVFISESDQLRGCLNEVGLDIDMIDEIGLFVMARGKILELRRKEENMYQNLSNLEDENRKLVEELEKQRLNVENVGAEIRRLSAEVEQEKNRYANTKEKLTMAVTKGKALVQQRDSLKQLLAEKTSELEKCSIELQEKTTALEAAEKTKELIAESEKFSASLQQSLAEKDITLQKYGEILSDSVATEEPQPADITEKLRWIVDENKSLKTISLQYHKLTDALSLFDFPETMASSELDARIHWLAESFYLFKEEALRLKSEIARTKEAANGEIEHLTTSFLAETQEKSYLQAELDELRSKCEAHETLQHELAEAREAVNNEIDHLTTSLLAESQEKSYIQLELENLRHKHEELFQKEYLVSLEKDKIVSLLLDASGLTNDGQEEVHQGKSDMATIIDNCLAKIKENTRDFGPAQVDAKLFENFQSLLYIRDLEMNLCKLIVEDDTLDGVQVSRLSDELESKSQELDALQNEKAILSHELETKTQELNALKNEKAVMSDELEMKTQELNALKNEKAVVSDELETMTEELNALKNEKAIMSDELETKTQELNALQDEKAVMQDSLQQLEDRCALLKEKLSMAVKKGKGLFQDRENLKAALNEKNTEIDRLKSELEQSSSRYTECQDQINTLSLDVERISPLEMDLAAAKEHADQLERFLAESNSMLQRVMEAIESITTPTDLSFEEPVEKVKWVAGYLSENEVAKTEVDKELREVKDEASSLASKLSDVQTMMKSLEDALSIAENNRSQLLDEKKELEVSKALLEEELGNEKDRNSSHTSKFEELSLSKKELEDALSLAEENISRIMNEKDIAEESRALAEEQLQKLKEEFSNHITGLANADKTIQSLEDALFEAQNNISKLSEENVTAQIGRADLDSEIKKIREEADSHASKLADASMRIKSLEVALLNAENKMAELVQEKKNTEEEILALTSKLESCMEELAGIRGSMGSQSVELSAQLSRLQLLLKDETLSSLIGQSFGTKFESLHGMGFLLKEMWDCFQEADFEVLQNSPMMEDDSSILPTLPSSLDVSMNIKMLDDEAVDSDSIIVHIEKMNERFHLKGKILADKFGNLSAHMDESIAAMLRRLRITKDRIVSVIKYAKSLKSQMQDMETHVQRQDDTIVSLESDIRTLLSACADATQTFDSSARKSMLELRSIHELAELDGRMSLELRAVEDDVAAALVTDHVKIAEKLLLVTRQNRDLSELFQDAIKKLTTVKKDTQRKLKETQLTCDEALEEGDRYKDKISKLDTDLKEQQNLYHRMMRERDDYKEKLDKLRERETELSTSLSKIRELEDSVLSAAQVKSILDKMNEIEVPDAVYAVGDSHESADVRKLYYVIDSFNESLQRLNSLSRENEKLQSTIDKQILEIDFLKKQVEDHMNNEKDSEKMSKLLELESGLQNIIRKLGGGDLMDDLKEGAMGPLPLIDKLVAGKMLESESLKSKNEELGAKLLGTQKIVDDLSNKVKLLEDSDRARTLPPEIDQERGTSVASSSTQSEISEIQDTAPLGKANNIPIVPSAAHARMLRKGSSDHLAINIDSESERLINNKESDEDKGHAFKSLNTSGLIPRQGRAVADRIDGIWVSGSRALMSHPRGRLGLIAYWLVLHIWLVGTVVL
ncbi:E3 ubiquitin ligase involved in syntaxin degradation [Handroanthus impetiginosus]|uniref:E3 ubiquitin ligase involved in syntaxin degradation n=1 Tax=Handroanthus impetiginosus TaxID=429701 RepID=A0A2G9GWZ2_9LAMI|nr:E3 ubiquitin ligase involved in syntaxin degradation [Handroanthus impetiginosus]